LKTALCLLLVCLFSGTAVFAQSEEQTPTEIGVEEITLARDDGEGSPGEIVSVFSPNDVPIHCLIQLNSTKATAVKMNLIAVKANGLKPGTNVVTVNYKTNGNQNGVRFRASPDGVWAVGKYRVDIMLDGKTSKSLEFEVQKSAQPSPPPPTNKFAPRRSGKSRKVRKN
jgi:hypothetical protein